MNYFPIKEIQEKLNNDKNLYPFSTDIDFLSKLKLFFSSSELPRRSGRSYAMARILLENALETEGYIYLVDHFDTNDNRLSQKGHLFHLIEDWQSNFYNLGIEIVLKLEYNSSKFSADLRNKKSKDLYNVFKLNYEFPLKEEPREFSKLLLII